MGHVGDVYLEFKVAILETADGDGVIEIARRLSINSDDRQRAIVAPLAEFRGGNDGLDGLRRFENFRRETVG